MSLASIFVHRTPKVARGVISSKQGASPLRCRALRRPSSSAPASCPTRPGVPMATLDVISRLQQAFFVWCQASKSPSRRVWAASGSEVPS